MIEQRSNLSVILLCSVVFALFVAFAPWEAIRGDEFADLVNYTTRIYLLRDYGKNYFVWENSILGWLQFEYLWFSMLAWFADMDVAPIVFIKSITLISAFLTYRFLSLYIGVGWSFVVLTNPITIDLLSSQIRSAFAFALFLLAVSLRTGTKIDWLKYPLFICLPFIHSGMHLLLLIYFSCVAMAHRDWFRPSTKTVITVIVAIVTSVFIALYLPAVAEIAEDRRALSQYASKSAAYLSFWVLFAGALVISYSKENSRHWEYYFAMSICILGPLVELMNTPGFRFVALGIPVLFAAIIYLRGVVRDGVLLASPLYSILLFYYWVR